MEAGYGHGSDLTYHEYIAAAMHSRVDVNENRLNLIFSYLDSENKGHITVTNIRNVLGEDIPLPELESMIDAGDSGGNRHVTKK
jgi:hypothetical protein